MKSGQVSDFKLKLSVVIIWAILTEWIPTHRISDLHRSVRFIKNAKDLPKTEHQVEKICLTKMKKPA